MRSVLCGTLAALFLAFASAAAQEPDTRPGVAVFPFTNGGSVGPDREDLDLLSVGVQQMLLTELAQSSDLRVVERSALREILAEQDLVTADRVDPETAARVGRLVGARYAVTGVFTDIFGDFRLDGRVFDVETGEVLRAESVRGPRGDMYRLLVDLSTRIIAAVDLPPLPAALLRERQSRDYPPEALLLYSRAIDLQDSGETARAIELYRHIQQEFPQVIEAREALRQLTT